MQDELRLSLLIAGTLFIIAIFAHGMWKIRKQTKSEEKPSRLEPRSWSLEDDEELDGDDVSWREEDMGHRSESLRERSDVEDFDELGVGKVRVVTSGSSTAREVLPAEGKEGDDSSQQSTDSNSNSEIADETQKETSVKPETKLYGSVVSNPKPHMQAQRSGSESSKDEIPEPPGFLLKRQQEEQADQVRQAPSLTEDEVKVENNPREEKPVSEVDSFSLDAQPSPETNEDDTHFESGHGESLAEQARRFMSRKRSKSVLKKGRQEPKFGDDQMRIDFDEPAVAKSIAEEEQTDASEQKGESPAKAEAVPEQEVLVLNVRAADDNPISGAALLPMLLTLGFKFGDQDIFHRHVNSNGKGPVLFSLANMFKPGIFDIDNLETFTTQGVSLFMILPIEGDAHQVFNMMHNAARKIADEFGAQVLDGRRSIMSKQGVQQYIERIREFERLRMVKR
jgi:cell division protein ZipA